MPIAKLSEKMLLIILFWLEHFVISTLTAENVYFDKFGHCLRTQPFDLTSEDYILKHVGGGFVHETLVCDITFKSPGGFGVCLEFEEFEINDCSMRIKVFTSTSSTGTPWRVLDCTDSGPGHMCTSSQHVTVRVIKDKLNYNRGYAFEIRVTKSSSITDKGVLFASFGVFMAVILGAVFLTAVFAVSIIYCCCCKRKKVAKCKGTAKAEVAVQDSGSLVQPSAPPGDFDEHLWAAASRAPLYSQPCYDYTLQYAPPPPYMPPPPYHADATTMQVPNPKSNPNDIYTPT